MDKQRKELLGSRLLGVTGEVQRDGEVVHVLARKLERSYRSPGPLEHAIEGFSLGPSGAEPNPSDSGPAHLATRSGLLDVRDDTSNPVNKERDGWRRDPARTRLVCVRYRYDKVTRKRYKTIELIVERSNSRWAASP